MKTDLSDYRQNYNQNELLESDCTKNPMDLFKKWFTEADENDRIFEANAMTFATIGTDGFPKNRILLLKEFSNDGFVFFTNYNSEKGHAIKANNKVCISFFWDALERQVVVRGTVKKVSEELSDTYFASRPKESQLGALASPQSQIVTKEELEDNMKKLQELYKNKTVSRPENWGGYIVEPTSIEFWQGRPNRMHDRIEYTLKGDRWTLNRLAP